VTAPKHCRCLPPATSVVFRDFFSGSALREGPALGSSLDLLASGWDDCVFHVVSTL
jgi:hypothetical protein